MEDNFTTIFDAQQKQGSQNTYKEPVLLPETKNGYPDSILYTPNVSFKSPVILLNGHEQNNNLNDVLSGDINESIMPLSRNRRTRHKRYHSTSALTQDHPYVYPPVRPTSPQLPQDWTGTSVQQNQVAGSPYISQMTLPAGDTHSVQEIYGKDSNGVQELYQGFTNSSSGDNRDRHSPHDSQHLQPPLLATSYMNSLAYQHFELRTANLGQFSNSISAGDIENLSYEELKTRNESSRNSSPGNIRLDGESNRCAWSSCCLQFESQENLVFHILHDHIGMGKARYVCEWRGCSRNRKPFSKRHKIQNHVRIHTGERPFPCPVTGCGKRFSRQDGLLTHIKTHSDIKPFVCSFPACTKAYFHSRSLKKHERTHARDIKNDNDEDNLSQDQLNVFNETSNYLTMPSGAERGDVPLPMESNYDYQPMGYAENLAYDYDKAAHISNHGSDEHKTGYLMELAALTSRENLE